MVTVIIPVFNRPALVLRAVESVLGQTYRNFELIVVDDGSTEDLSAAASRVREAGYSFFRTPNRGVAAARNFGAARARGEWLGFLDSDDRWTPNKLAEQIEFLERRSGFRICQCEEQWYRNGSFVNPKDRHEKARGDAFQRSLELCCISPSSVLLSRDLFVESGGFDERMRVCEDYDLWLRLTAKHRVGYLDKRLVEKFGGHEDQLSRSEPAMDRFRIFSMVKLLVETDLEQSQVQAVLEELERKADVLAQGAEKRGSDDVAGLYRAVSNASAAKRKSGDYAYDAVRAEFAQFFAPLLDKMLHFVDVGGSTADAKNADHCL